MNDRMDPDLVDHLNGVITNLCGKTDMIPVYSGVERHSSIEWLAQRPMEPRVKTGANRLYVSMAAWVEDADHKFEFWAGTANDESARRDLVTRETVAPDHMVYLDEMVYSGWVTAVERAVRLFKTYGDLTALDERFTSSRAGDATSSAL